MNVAEVPLGNKKLVLQYLSECDLLNRKSLVVLMLGETLVPLDLAVRLLTPFNETELKELALLTSKRRASGILLIEVYPETRSWPFYEIDIPLLREQLSVYDVALLDLLVVERGVIRSKFFANDH